jgi:hypothetical protein
MTIAHDISHLRFFLRVTRRSPVSESRSPPTKAGRSTHRDRSLGGSEGPSPVAEHAQARDCRPIRWGRSALTT